MYVCIGGGARAYAALTRALGAHRPVLLAKGSGGCAEVAASLTEEWRRALGEGKKLSVKQVADLTRTKEKDKDVPSRKLASVLEDVMLREHYGGSHDGLEGTFASGTVGGGETATDRRAPSLVHVYSGAHRPFDDAIFDATVGAQQLLEQRQRERERRVRGVRRLRQPMAMRPLPVHVAARRQHPLLKANRKVHVSDAAVPWSVPCPSYKPTFYEHEHLKEHATGGGTGTGTGWADLADVAKAIPPSERHARMSFELRPLREGTADQAHLDLAAAGIEVYPSNATRAAVDDADAVADVAGALGALLYRGDQPLNPRGRTGMTGRGVLGRWGPNHAADPIVTRWDPAFPEGAVLQVVAVQRKETGEWALPGGMVDAGEAVALTVLREFQGGASSSDARNAEADKMERLLKLLFASGEVVYRGYVDDARNTDNAWLETTAIHYHCSRDLAQRLVLQPGDDAAAATWVSVDAESDPRYADLYAPHRAIVDGVSERLHVHVNSRLNTRRHASYPDRYAVSDAMVPWDVALSGYSPEDYTDARVLRASRAPNQGATASAPADPHYTSAAEARQARHGHVPNRTLWQELHEERYSCEGPITFGKADGRPLNPRGRTGLRGRGLLPQWGVNEAVDALVTRHHPRDHRLQFVAVMRPDGSWAIPGGMLDAGEHAATHARRLVHERLVCAQPREAWEGVRIAALLDELFGDAEEDRVVYEGYVDDPRNTDNAWVETTAFHVHCARELGGRLALLPSDDETAPYDAYCDMVRTNGARWLTVSVEDDRYARMYANHRTLVDRVAKRMRHAARRPPLLQSVVGWGKREWVERLLTTPSLLGLRSAAAVQLSLEHALRLAAAPDAFDVMIVEQLLSHGARPEDVFVSALFDESSRCAPQPSGQRLDIGGLAPHAVGDAFGLMRAVRSGAYASDEDARREARTRSRRRGRRTAPSWLDWRSDWRSAWLRSAWLGGEEAPGRRAHAKQRTPRMHALRPPPLLRCLPMVNHAAWQAAARRVNREEIREFEAHQRLEAHGTPLELDLDDPMLCDGALPYRPEHIHLMEALVHGFGKYAATRPSTCAVDLCLWAIACGSFDLALALWRTSEAPLRVALLGQHLCRLLVERAAIRIHELTTLQQRLASYTIAILDELRDHEQARRLLLVTTGPYAWLGSTRTKRAPRPASILEVAIGLGDGRFVAHSHCQCLLEEIWRGRTPDAGRVCLVRSESLRRLLLQVVLGVVGLQVVQLRVNDLHADHASHRSLVSSPRLRVSAIRSLFEFYRIPLVKRAAYLASYFGYLCLALATFYARPCGAAGVRHYLMAAWTGAMLVGEAQRHLLASLPCGSLAAAGGRLGAWGVLDVLAPLALALALTCRFLLLDPAGVGLLSRPEIRRFPGSSSLLDYIARAAPEWGLRRFEYATPIVPSTAWGTSYFDDGECQWSIELECMRASAAIGLAAATFRLIEPLLASREAATLRLCASRILSEFASWLRSTLLLSLAFGLALGVLSPMYHLDGSVGPLTPLPTLALDVSAGGALWAPLWALFGFVEPSSVAHRSPGGSILSPLCLWLYLLVALFLVLNLALAVISQHLSQSHAEAKEAANNLWQMRRAALLRRYITQPSLPPPLNLVGLVFEPFFLGVRAVLTMVHNLRRRRTPRGIDDGGADMDGKGGGGGGGGGAHARSHAHGKRAKRLHPEAVASTTSEVRLEGAGYGTLAAAASASRHDRDALVYSHEYATIVETEARTRVLQRERHDAHTANAQVDAVRAANRRVEELQSDVIQERVELMRALEKMRKQKLLDVLPDLMPAGVVDEGVSISGVSFPVGAADGSLAGASGTLGDGPPGSQRQMSKQQSIVNLSFARALKEVVQPLVAKVDGVDGAVKDLQKKVATASDPHGPALAAARSLFGKQFSYMQTAHAAGARAYRAPPTVGAMGDAAPQARDAQGAPRVATTYDATPRSTLPPLAPGETSACLAATNATSLPPPPATDAGPDPYSPEVVATFRRYDRDQSGSMDVAELRGALLELGLAADTSQTAKLLAKFDSDRSGRLEIEEFASLVAELMRFQAASGAPSRPTVRAAHFQTTLEARPPSPPAPITDLPARSAAARDEIERIFALVDTDASGDIDATELRTALDALGLSAGMQQASQILARYDDDHSRRLDLREFKRLVSDIRRYQTR